MEGWQEAAGEAGTMSRLPEPFWGTGISQAAHEVSFCLIGGLTLIQVLCKQVASFSKRSPSEASLSCRWTGLLNAKSKPTWQCTYQSHLLTQ